MKDIWLKWEENSFDISHGKWYFRDEKMKDISLKWEENSFEFRHRKWYYRDEKMKEIWLKWEENFETGNSTIEKRKWKIFD